MTSLTRDEHLYFLRIALAKARLSPPKPTNFCVGAVVISPSRAQTGLEDISDPNDDPRTLVTGYTLECPGNTHAEQSCFIKLAQQYSCNELKIGEHLPEDAVLYTTMEPCNKRSAGSLTCVERILALKRGDGRQAIQTVVVGVSEPETFVGINEGRSKLEDAGIKIAHVDGLEEEILEVAKAGHVKDET